MFGSNQQSTATIVQKPHCEIKVNSIILLEKFKT